MGLYRGLMQHRLLPKRGFRKIVLRRVFALALFFPQILVSGIIPCEAASAADTQPATAPIGVIRGGGGALVGECLGPIVTPHRAPAVSYTELNDARGIEKLEQGEFAFAGLDGPATGVELNLRRPGAYSFFPIAMSATVFVYNLPDLNHPLVLDPRTIVGIFSGRITNWSDVAFKSLNPGQQLPDLKITVLLCPTLSGNAWSASHYLSAIDEDWSRTVGFGRHPQWPVGEEQRVPDRFIQAAGSTPGAIAFTFYPFAKTNKLPCASLVNANGESVDANPESIAAAASHARLVPSEMLDVTNSKEKGAYPVAYFLQLVVPSQRQGFSETARDFFQNAVNDGRTRRPEFVVPITKELGSQIISLLDGKTPETRKN